MVDIWELTKFVEDHPDNLDQRWRLVKAYYKDKDYRLALEHLLILRKEESISLFSSYILSPYPF